MRIAAALLASVLALAACEGHNKAAALDGSIAAKASSQPATAESLGAPDAASDADAEAESLGPPHHVEGGLCTALGHPGGSFAQFVASRDLTTTFVDGDDLLALANRSPLGALPPDYAPSDMVELHGGAPATARECDRHYDACLRRDAADALTAMTVEMKKAGFSPRIESAYRSYASQCGVFKAWIKKDEEAAEAAHEPSRNGFCSVSEQSALAGHSQHQLGTTIDLFTEEWFLKDKDKGSFRDGFGCTNAGKWLAQHSWEHGFVFPYPLHPDDRLTEQPCLARWDIFVPPNPRTGYRHEPWHLRFIGRENAAHFHEAWSASVASASRTPQEITLEQWLRARIALAGDADLPVCDGCSCGACATLAPDVASMSEGGVAKPEPCKDDSLWLDARGRAVDAEKSPTIEDARVSAMNKDGSVVVEVKVAARPHTLTQPPVLGARGPAYVAGATFESLVPYPRTLPHRFDELPGAWRVAIEPTSREGADAPWPWRASLAKDSLARAYNRANLYLPAQPGEHWLRVTITPPSGTTRVRITLLRDGAEHDTREIDLSVAKAR